MSTISPAIAVDMPRYPLARDPRRIELSCGNMDHSIALLVILRNSVGLVIRIT